MKTKKILFIALSVGLLILLDFSPAIYQRVFGNGGTFVRHYGYYKISEDSLIKIINHDFSKTNATQDRPYITSVSKDQNSGCTYIRIYDKNRDENIHLWVQTIEDIGAEIVFYGVSNSLDFQDCRRINLEDYITRQIKTKRFEKLIINQINAMSNA